MYFLNHHLVMTLNILLLKKALSSMHWILKWIHIFYMKWEKTILPNLIVWIIFSMSWLIHQCSRYSLKDKISKIIFCKVNHIIYLRQKYLRKIFLKAWESREFTVGQLRTTERFLFLILPLSSIILRKYINTHSYCFT